MRCKTSSAIYTTEPVDAVVELSQTKAVFHPQCMSQLQHRKAKQQFTQLSGA